MVVCPNNQSLEADIGKSTAVATWTDPQATDNSGQKSTIICSIESGSQFEIGLTEVVCKALDATGNQATCAFTVEIKGEKIKLIQLLSNTTTAWITKRTLKCQI